MSITGQCPECGKPYSVGNKFAGHRITCEQCGEELLVISSEVAPKRRVECEHCGRGHWVSAENVGKKTVCKNCGAKFRIVLGGASPDRSPSGREVDAESPAPLDLDVFGLNEEPVVPLSGDDDLSEAQKNNITRGAVKVEKSKVSTATVGVSFAAGLAFALIGWRVYRVLNQVEQAPNPANGNSSAPAEVYVVDRNTAAAKADREVGMMIVQPTTSEARDWLDPDKYPNHAVKGMPTQTAREMVAGFYERGAGKVYTLDPSSVNGMLVAGQLAIRLPQDPARRKRCFEWAAKHDRGAVPAPDLGQKYLLITMD